MHWLLFHLLVLIILFITSIILFVVQISLWKLVGIIPVMVAIFSMYCWAKVGNILVLSMYILELQRLTGYVQGHTLVASAFCF